MPRPNLGPKLTTIRKRGWNRTLYYIRWTEGKPRWHGTGIDIAAPDAARRAEEYFAQWLRARAKARRKGPGDPDQVWIADVIEDYVAEHGSEVASPGTLMGGARPLQHFFRSDTLATMTPNRVREYWPWRRGHQLRVLDKDRGEVEIRTAKIGDGTVIRELAGILRPAIQHAINQRRLQPGEYHVPVPSAPAGRDYWITRSEAARLVWETRRSKRARLHLPLYALIALYTGQRRGAILDLTWPQIDFVRGRIDFNPRGRAQTKKRRPIIPVPRSLLAALRRAHKRATGRHVIAYHGERVGSIKTGFRTAAKRAGIPSCTSHTLRHTCATWMAHKGVPLREIAGYLGHSEARTTELYAHHSPGFMASARKALERT